MPIRRLLIANRGEIARRIIRTAKRIGIVTILVHSDADALSPATREADETYHLRGDYPKDTYLNISAIIGAAKERRADAIHPGYGFLSENPQFAKACEDNHIIFIGPSSRVLEHLGNKTAAKKTAMDNSVPTVPGIHRPLKDAQEAKTIAKQWGYPVLLKAAAGGGGRGIREVRSEQEMESAFETAAKEAQDAFKKGDLFIEKLLTHVKHIEVQMVRDSMGNGIAFGERDCSLQRRHQKLIEEAPGPTASKQLREKLQEYAKRLFKAVDYVGIGTVEFLVDIQQNAYFLEVNGRIQVEHPITEMVYDVDFVELQIRIAQKEKLSLKEPVPKGHAMEVRILAENPYENGAPQHGWIRDIQVPLSEHMRFDRAVERGTSISPYYDSMIGKLIAWGEDRHEAKEKLLKALESMHIDGIITNIAYARELLRYKSVAEGTHTTESFSRFSPESIPEELIALAAALYVVPPKMTEIKERVEQQ